MTFGRRGGPLAPAAFEWRYVTARESTRWREDVATTLVDFDSLDVDQLITHLVEQGVTRMVVRSSEWPDDSMAARARAASLVLHDLEPDSLWCHQGSAVPAPRAVALATVVINTTVTERDAVLELLRVWSTPSGAPLAAGDESFHLVLLLNQEPGEGYRAAVADAMADGELQRSIDDLTFVPLHLAAEDDRYERGQHGDPGDYGFKSGPNVQFFRGLDALTGQDDFALIVETDTRPIRRGWLSAARDLVDREGDAWVIGSVYRGPERTLHHTSRSHLNGNAIYALNQEFAEFRATCWEPLLKQFVKTRPYVAYDFALTLAMTTADGAAAAPELLANWHRFRASEFVQNLVVWGRFDPDAVDWEPIVDRLRLEHPATYLLHGVRGARRPPWS